MLLTVGKLAARYDLSRSTLLYYDTIGLLKPTFHRAGEYRHYSETDEERLAQICAYREAGIPLKDIKVMLDAPTSGMAAILDKRFAELNDEIRKLYQQQRIIAGLLKACGKVTASSALTKELWVSLLEQAGFSEQDMFEWHIAFEQTAPEKHQLFLEHLHIPDEEIRFIRSWVKKPPA